MGNSKSKTNNVKLKNHDQINSTKLIPYSAESNIHPNPVGGNKKPSTAPVRTQQPSTPSPPSVLLHPPTAFPPSLSSRPSNTPFDLSIFKPTTSNHLFNYRNSQISFPRFTQSDTTGVALLSTQKAKDKNVDSFNEQLNEIPKYSRTSLIDSFNVPIHEYSRMFVQDENYFDGIRYLLDFNMSSGDVADLNELAGDVTLMPANNIDRNNNPFGERPKSSSSKRSSSEEKKPEKNTSSRKKSPKIKPSRKNSPKNIPSKTFSPEILLSQTNSPRSILSKKSSPKIPSDPSSSSTSSSNPSNTTSSSSKGPKTVARRGCCVTGGAPPVYISSGSGRFGSNANQNGRNCAGRSDNPLDRLRNVDVIESLSYYPPGGGGGSDDEILDMYAICNDCSGVEYLGQKPQAKSKREPVTYTRKQRFNFHHVQEDDNAEENNDNQCGEGPPFIWPSVANPNCPPHRVESFDEIPVGKNPGCSSSNREDAPGKCFRGKPGEYYFDEEYQCLRKREESETGSTVSSEKSSTETSSSSNSKDASNETIKTVPSSHKTQSSKKDKSHKSGSKRKDSEDRSNETNKTRSSRKENESSKKKKHRRKSSSKKIEPLPPMGNPGFIPNPFEMYLPTPSSTVPSVGNPAIIPNPVPMGQPPPQPPPSQPTPSQPAPSQPKGPQPPPSQPKGNPGPTPNPVQKGQPPKGNPGFNPNLFQMYLPSPSPSMVNQNIFQVGQPTPQPSPSQTKQNASVKNQKPSSTKANLPTQQPMGNPGFTPSQFQMGPRQPSRPMGNPGFMPNQFQMGPQQPMGNPGFMPNQYQMGQPPMGYPGCIPNQFGCPPPWNPQSFMCNVPHSLGFGCSPQPPPCTVPIVVVPEVPEKREKKKKKKKEKKETDDIQPVQVAVQQPQTNPTTMLLMVAEQGFKIGKEPKESTCSSSCSKGEKDSYSGSTSTTSDSGSNSYS